jgi:hypothetical protein
MSAPQTPNLPSVTDTGTLINASGSDWRAILIAIMFLFIAFIVFTVWREVLNWKLAKSMDGIRDALNALKIVIVEEAAEQRGRASMQDLRQKRQERRQDRQDQP